MGMNYYLVGKSPCQACHRAYPALHIGKKSVGYKFTLHVFKDREDGPTNLHEWTEKFREFGVFIEDEMGKRVTKEKILDMLADGYTTSTADFS